MIPLTAHDTASHHHQTAAQLSLGPGCRCPRVLTNPFLRPPPIAIEPVALAAGAGHGFERVGAHSVAASPDRAADLPFGVGASVLLHLLVLAAFALLPTPSPLRPLPIESIKVDFVPPPQPAPPSEPAAATKPEAAPGAPTAQPSAPAPLPATPNPLPAPIQQPMVKAEKFYSARVLADPRSRGARRALPQLAPQERIIQLCDIEALAQVRQQQGDFQPDLVVPYAMAEVKLAGEAMEAKGGAVRSRHHWYELKFNCTVAPDLKNVVAFEFLLGKEIPRDQWASHDLTVDDGPAD